MYDVCYLVEKAFRGMQRGGAEVKFMNHALVPSKHEEIPILADRVV